jgi:hypothetical protein
MKYVNRLTPMTLMAKATEKGLEELGNTVLSAHLNLTMDSGDQQAFEGEESRDSNSSKMPNHSVS